MELQYDTRVQIVRCPICLKRFNLLCARYALDSKDGRICPHCNTASLTDYIIHIQPHLEKAIKDM